MAPARIEGDLQPFVPDVGVLELACRTDEPAEEPQSGDGVGHVLFWMDGAGVFKRCEGSNGSPRETQK